MKASYNLNLGRSLDIPHMFVCRLFAITMLVLAPEITLGASQGDDFKNDELVASASKDIIGMPRTELDSFITYLASCWSSQIVDESTANFTCERDRQMYLTKFARGRSVDRMIRTLAITQEYVKALDKTAKPNTKERADLVQNMSRQVQIHGHFEEAANFRSRDLMKEGQ